MSVIHVRKGRELSIGTLTVPCTIGKGGLLPAADKREGDGATPIGSWPLREVFYRPDRFDAPPATALPIRPLSQDDGWCDAPDDPNYNRPVRLPYGASTESLWRDDTVYDVIVVLGHNDDPVVPYGGSAIFFHLMAPDRRPTEGCVAVTRDAMLQVLTMVDADSTLIVHGDSELA